MNTSETDKKPMGDVNDLVSAEGLPNVIKNIMQLVTSIASGTNDFDFLIVIKPEMKGLIELMGDSLDPDEKYEILHFLRQMFIYSDNVFNEVVDMDFIIPLVECLMSSYPTKLNLKALEIITDITNGPISNINQVVAAGAVPLLLQLLYSNETIINEKAISVLSNIIAVSSELRDFVIKHGLLKPLLSFVKHDTPLSMLENVVTAIANVCQDKTAPLSDYNVQKIVPVLNLLTNHENSTILAKVVEAVFCITCFGQKQTQIIIDEGFVPKLIIYMQHNSEEVKSFALKAVRCIVRNTKKLKRIMFNTEALSNFSSLLLNQDKGIRIHAFRFLAHITVDNKSQTEVVISVGLVPIIIANLTKGGVSAHRQAVEVFYNLIATEASLRISTFIKETVITDLCNLLAINEVRVTIFVLKCLEILLMKSELRQQEVKNLIHKANGVPKLKILTTHTVIGISKLASKLCLEYFPTQSPTDEPEIESQKENQQINY